MITFIPRKSVRLLTAATLAVTAAVCASVGRADNSVGYTTISISGSTAIKNFQNAAGSSWLTPGQTFTDSNGSVTAPNNISVQYQLAPTVYENPPVTDSTKADTLRVEYHLSGSVEGIQDLVQSQIGSGVNWNPTSGNPVFVNRTQYNTTGTQNGWTLTQQNAVQLAISDVNSTEGFRYAGTPSVTAAPGSAGYGQGNPALSSSLTTNAELSNLTNASGIRAALVDSSVLMMPSTKFGVGDWNTATIANTQNTKFAVTATLFAANPGTGLSNIDRTDAQWLQTTSRLQNGATFNFSSRDVNSGTRNVAANNTGVDPSWAVGKNDAGNGFLSTATTTQDSLNPNGVTFSNKTSGGSQLLPTLLVNRMSIGTIGLSDAIGSVSTSGSNGSNPLRALAYSDSADGSSPYVQANASTITNGSYVIWQNETYVTLKDPNGFNAANGTWASQTDAQTGILGDTQGAVAAYRQNVLYAATNEATLAGVNNPGDTLIAQSFIPEQYMAVTKTLDGLNTTSANPSYDSSGNSNLINFFGTNFATTNTATIGNGSSVYGNNGKSVYTTPAQGNIIISNTNYLFGNFSQTGSRDLTSVASALNALKAYNTAFGSGAAYNTGALNSSGFSYTAIATLTDNGNGTFTTTNGSSISISKGDAIVMGDTLSRGMFDGMDLRNLAEGAALSDASGAGNANGTLTTASGATLGDQLRNGVLRKNTALDYIQANTTAGDPIRVSASQNIINDPTGINAFNKFDVNHDGLVTRADALTVDTLLGKDYTNLNDQLGVTLKDNNGNQQSLVDAVLTDDHTTVARSDLNLITGDLITNGDLVLGDANFDGSVNLTDLATVLNNFGNATQHWTSGNFDGASTVGLTDLADVLNDFGRSASGAVSVAATPTIVPEPASLGLLGIGALMLFRRRRSH